MRALTILLLLALAGCASARGPAGSIADREGRRFLCGPQDARSLCLPVLTRQCDVRFVEGESIPAEAEERIVVRRGGGPETKVLGPADLAGCVRIGNGAEALEYLRLFSSFATVHLFEPQRLEVFPGPDGEACWGTCLGATAWWRLKLTEAAVKTRDDGSFEVTRIVMKPEPQAWMPTLYRAVERITPDGAVEILSETAIHARQKDLGGLTFPMYL